jgi:hypothetical protein
MVTKWYFADMVGDPDEVDTRLLQTALPVEPGYSSPEYQGLRSAIILWTLVNCLRQLAWDDLLHHRGRPIIAFCSVVDSADACWVELETARLINPPKVFSDFEPECRAYQTLYWAKSKPTQLKDYFDRLGRKV